MRILATPCLTLLLALAVVPSPGQRHTGNWIRRAAADTTVVPCVNDPQTWFALPPRALGRVMPDRLYMRLERMSVESLPVPYDTSFVGWCRVNAGSDSVRSDLLRIDASSGRLTTIQFARALSWQLHWDSLDADRRHRSWRLTGMKGWTGASWVAIPGVSIAGNIVRFNRAHAFAAYAFVGAPAPPAEPAALPLAYTLHQSYPRPENPSTEIHFTIPEAGFVSLEVFNMLGEKVVVVVSENLPAGAYTKSFNAEHLVRGAYFYRLTSGHFVDTKKFVLAR